MSNPSSKSHGNPMERMHRAFCDDDAPTVRGLLDRHPEFKARINEPVGEFGTPAVTQARSRAMLDVLLDAGADINARSRWWAGGFGLLDLAKPELAAYAIERGATVDAHAAARLGLVDRLRQLIAADPDCVHAPGGDGQTPLHFASTVEIAALLLDHGARINARDVDHESTPAQYMIRDRQPIAKYLIGRGCASDLLMAAALGDKPLARARLKDDADCIRVRVNDDCFPKNNPRSGGTIYQWTLGWHVSPHEVARNFGHAEFFRWLFDESPSDVQLLVSCWTADEAAVKAVVRANPGLVSRLTDADRQQIAHAARNNNAAAVQAMLVAGLPVHARGQHHATPLHWAAWHGNTAMVRELLRHQPDLTAVDADFKATPLGWAIHGSENGWHCRTGDYGGTVEALLEAGAAVATVGGTEPVRKALARHRGRG
jgi:Ankyrin repeats (3 copies)/Ankyrin repeat